MRLGVGLALLLAPALASAQPAPLRLVTAAGVIEIAAATTRAPALYPAAALERIGGAVQPDVRGARVTLFGDTLVFATLSPFFTVGNQVFQLAMPVRQVNGALHLPEQFFIEWLPARYAAHVEYRAGALHARTMIAAGPQPAAADRAQPVAAVAEPAVIVPAPAMAATRVVIIDPGHGGRDPGKIGPTGLREKDATLTLATRLAGLLRERGYEVHLTRTKDTLVALDDRPRLANQWKANRPALFMSIHANSFSRPTVQGFETFFLSAARTEDERRVAEMENAAVHYEDEPALNGGVVDHILADMMNDFYVRSSSDLAETVQDRLATFHTGPNRGVKRAGFRVLVGALMPAVLVEVAFISSPTEARLLGTSAFQQKVAWGLADAVDAFFERNAHLFTTGPR